MMLSVLQARFLAESNLANDAEEADRGSEIGECRNSLDDEFDDGAATLSGEQ